MKARLYLDVDGVLNCIGRYQDNYECHVLDGTKCYIPPGTHERIQQLLDEYEIVWATAWRGSAHLAWRDVLGLPRESFEHIDYQSLKLPEIIKHAGKRRWAWIDDDANFEFNQLGWTDKHVAGLVLSPDTERGLNDEHVRQLLDFARS